MTIPLSWIEAEIKGLDVKGEGGSGLEKEFRC